MFHPPPPPFARENVVHRGARMFGGARMFSGRGGGGHGARVGLQRTRPERPVQVGVGPRVRRRGWGCLPPHPCLERRRGKLARLERGQHGISTSSVGVDDTRVVIRRRIVGTLRTRWGHDLCSNTRRSHATHNT